MRLAWSAALSVILTFPRCFAATSDELMGLGAALLDSDFMPPSLLLQSRVPPPKSQSNAVNNATVTVALSTMNYHRKMMNEYLCRGYMAEDILDRLQQDADETLKDNSLQQRRGNSGNTTRKPMSSKGQNSNHRSNQLLTDEGSTNYRDWLARSAVLEDIYRRYEHVGHDDDETEQDEGEDRHGDGRDEDYDGEVTGWAMEDSGHWTGGKQDTSREPHHEDLAESYGHHQHEYAEPIHSGSAATSALSLGIRDIFDVALTAIALLAFGIFILNVFLGILLPNSSTRTVVISNLTLPFRNREGALDMGSGDFTHERIARWVEDAPERLETAEEGAARLALASLKAALMPPTKQAHCVQSALCKGNKESRELEGHSKYWIPVWSLGMSWLARRGVDDAEPGTSALFSGALENLRAATLGLAGARCHELFPQC